MIREAKPPLAVSVPATISLYNKSSCSPISGYGVSAVSGKTPPSLSVLYCTAAASLFKVVLASSILDCSKVTLFLSLSKAPKSSEIAATLGYAFKIAL